MSLLFARSRSPENEAFCQYVARQVAPRGWGASGATSMGVYSDGKFQGAIVFHNWNPECETIFLSAAGKPGWLTQEALFFSHQYVFDQCRCQLACLEVSENNKRMCRIAQAFGYDGHVIPRFRGRQEGGILYTLTDEAWRENAFTRRFVARNLELL